MTTVGEGLLPPIATLHRQIERGGIRPAHSGSYWVLDTGYWVLIPAVSVPSNIAEGQAHHNNREFLHFLLHATGSLAELETQLVLAERLAYADHPSISPTLERVHEVGRILNGLISSIREQIERG